MSDLSAMTKAGFVATPAEWDRLVSAAEILAQRALQMERERDAAWKELRAIRDIVSADENEATEDEVSRVVYQRDQARGLLALARAEVARLTAAAYRIRGEGERLIVLAQCKCDGWPHVAPCVAQKWVDDFLRVSDAALRGQPAPAKE